MLDIVVGYGIRDVCCKVRVLAAKVNVDDLCLGNQLDIEGLVKQIDQFGALLETQSVQGGLKGLCPASEAVWLLR